MPEITATTTLVAYAYLVRWEWTTPRGRITQSEYGSLRLAPGSSRHQVLTDLVAKKTRELGGAVPSPVSFSIERDTLA